MKVSILVAAWNEEKNIKRFILQFKKISYNKTNLILVAGGTNKTFEIAKRYASKKIMVLKQKEPNKNKALNIGLKRFKGDFLVLTDIDCFPTNDWLKKLLEKASKYPVMTGPILPPDEQLSNPFVCYQYSSIQSKMENVSGFVGGVFGGNIVISKEVVKEIRSFDETFITGTDYDLAKRLLKKGYKIKFVNASIKTYLSPNIGKYFKRQARWMKNILIHAPKYGAYDEVKKVLFSSFTSIFFFLILILAILLRNNIVALLFLLMYFYGIYRRIDRAVRLKKKEKRINLLPIFLRIPLYIFVDHFARVLALFDYVIPSRRVRW